MLLTALLLLAQAPAPEAKVVNSIDPPFRLEVPAGYQLVELRGRKPFYVRRYPTSTDALELHFFPHAGLVVEGMAGPHGFLRSTELPPEARDEPLQAVWRGLPLYAVEHRWYTSAAQHMSHTAAVPLLPKGLILRIQGPASRELDLKTDFAKVLASVKGTTDWTSPQEKADQKKANLSLLIGALSGGLYFALWAGVFRNSFRMAHWPRTGWLFLTGVCFSYPAFLGVNYWSLAAGAIFVLIAVRRVKMGIELG
jgi:hypothetical protein